MCIVWIYKLIRQEFLYNNISSNNNNVTISQDILNPGIFNACSIFKTLSIISDDEAYWETWLTKTVYSGIFRYIQRHSIIFCHVQTYWGTWSHTEAYWAIFGTLCNPCIYSCANHIHNPGTFRTWAIFKHVRWPDIFRVLG